ncbi:MAG: hypothetical protein F4Y03_03875 [Alphaproteobacteria bacterium]|nr:hypothetical protein [Alphaproteobacteria bacterium]
MSASPFNTLEYRESGSERQVIFVIPFRRLARAVQFGEAEQVHIEALRRIRDPGAFLVERRRSAVGRAWQCRLHGRMKRPVPGVGCDA